ncbi:hypothetical protein N7539_004656 [Penicillium diatomitis]|uniref:Uncharacterized protein n=1 Tax=Penicillium diatomitis TaxID=2819901 RepID=A0A9W9XEI2_9EURO|nr:uncharacterized protein N7539_004656 [Penicillium diatomitis]KAJ5489766.1 hypothetical protein N7539_004656 [Penicillium diatomitis]
MGSMWDQYDVQLESNGTGYPGDPIVIEESRVWTTVVYLLGGHLDAQPLGTGSHPKARPQIEEKPRM